jgi:hypothetical protein
MSDRGNLSQLVEELYLANKVFVDEGKQTKARTV